MWWADNATVYLLLHLGALHGCCAAAKRDGKLSTDNRRWQQRFYKGEDEDTKVNNKIWMFTGILILN